MTRQARIHPDTNVLVTAAAGGVGTAAIQVAAFCGATVTAAAGSEEKLELARKLGAQRTVGYEEIGELDDIDVAFDPVGGPVFTACIKALRPLGVAIGIGFAGGTWEPVDPARLVGRNVGVQGFYLGRLMGFRPDLVRLEVARAARALAPRGAPSGRRRRVPARAGERGARPDRVAAVDGQGRPCSLRPPSSRVPPAESAARSSPRFEADGAAVRGLDLTSGFDVSDPQEWLDVRPADLVCLNAGVLAKGDGTIDDYRRILGVNVDGVVFGMQALAPRMRPGSAFVVTASLAGPDPDAVRPALRADQARRRRLRALDGRGAGAARDPRQPRLPRDRADADDGAGAGEAGRGRLPADGAGADRGGGARGGAERADRPGVGLPARPRADALPLPERPRPAGRGRRRAWSRSCEARDAARLRRPDRVGRDGAGGRPARLPLRLDVRGLGRRRGHRRLLDRGDDGADRDRHGDHADAGAHAGDDRDDRGDARPALRRPRPARPRHVRPAGGRGLARRPLGQAARAHARVRRDRPRRAAPRDARAPRPPLRHPLLRRGRDRPRQAAEADPEAAAPRRPDLPRRARPEERRPRRRDRRRLAADLLLPVPLPRDPRPLARATRRRASRSRRSAPSSSATTSSSAATC